MPSISQAFPLTELPQTSLPIKAPVVSTQYGSQIFLGICCGSISSFSLKPVPRQLWSYPIPPTCIVSSIYAHEGDVYYGSRIRNKTQLTKIKSGEMDNESQTKSVQVDQEIVGISSSLSDSSNSTLYTVSASSNIYTCSLNLDDDLQLAYEPSPSDQTKRELLFYKFIAPDNEDSDGPEDGVVVLVSKRFNKASRSDSRLEIRILALNGQNQVLELISKDFSRQEDDQGIFGAFETSLFRYLPKSNTLQLYSLPELSITTIDLPSEESSSSSISIQAIDNNKVLLCRDQDLVLIDTVFESILAQRRFEFPLSLCSYSKRTRTLIAISQQKSPEIVGISLNSGNGSLLQSLGKGIKTADDRFELGLPDIFIKTDYGINEYRQIEMDIITTTGDNARKILSQLQKWKLENDIQAFNTKVVAYLKGSDWEDESQVMLETESEEVHEADKDREVDYNFMCNLVSFLFESSSDQKKSLKLSFVPEILIIYLLTHPLFPTSELPDLLNALTPYPRLFRQAVVTCPALECDDLVSALDVSHDEIFGDVVTRISEDFGPYQITQSIRQVLLKVSGQSTINQCVDRMRKLDIGWEIMSCFIDAGGLFEWDQPTVEALKADIDYQVECLEASSEIMGLIQETLRKVDNKSTGVISKKEIKKLKKKAAEAAAAEAEEDKTSPNMPHVISQFDRERDMTKGLLGFGVKHNEQQRPAKNDFNKKMPLYTIERLVL